MDAAWNNRKGLALDALGWVALAAFPEGSAGTAIVGSAIGLAAIGVAASDSGDHPALAAVSGSIAYVSKHGAVAEGLFHGAAAQLVTGSAYMVSSHRAHWTLD